MKLECHCSDSETLLLSISTLFRQDFVINIPPSGFACGSLIGPNAKIQITHFRVVEANS